MNKKGSAILVAVSLKTLWFCPNLEAAARLFLVIFEVLNLYMSRKSEHARIATFHALDQCKAGDRPLIIS